MQPLSDRPWGRAIAVNTDEDLVVEENDVKAGQTILVTEPDTRVPTVRPTHPDIVFGEVDSAVSCRDVFGSDFDSAFRANGKACIDRKSHDRYRSHHPPYREMHARQSHC
jgi:hypothetical protein